MFLQNKWRWRSCRMCNWKRYNTCSNKRWFLFLGLGNVKGKTKEFETWSLTPWLKLTYVNLRDNLQINVKS